MTVRGPKPILRGGDEATDDRVLVYLVELFHALVLGEDVEVVITNLPKGPLRGELRDGNFQSLERFGERLGWGFAQEKVDVFGHDDVTHHLELVPLASGFQGSQKEVASGGGVQLREPVIAAKGEEVVVAFLLVSVEAGGHGVDCTFAGEIVVAPPTLGTMKLCRRWGTRLEARLNAVIDGTDDEDVQAEYGNDLAQLEMTRERIEAAACVEFGPGVRVFSREPVGLRLRVREGGFVWKAWPLRSL